MKRTYKWFAPQSSCFLRIASSTLKIDDILAMGRKYIESKREGKKENRKQKRKTESQKQKVKYKEIEKEKKKERKKESKKKDVEIVSLKIMSSWNKDKHSEQIK